MMGKIDRGKLLACLHKMSISLNELVEIQGELLDLIKFNEDKKKVTFKTESGKVDFIVRRGKVKP